MFVGTNYSALAVLVAAGRALGAIYTVANTYNASNFFDGFEFMTHEDYNGGYVKYQSLTESLESGIAAIRDGEVYLGVDHDTELSPLDGTGRGSFRVESRAAYGHGLIVARFSHFPKSACGSWPAFWTLGVGKDWPNAGEIDIIEGWNENRVNRPALHTGATDLNECVLDGADQTSALTTINCDNTYANPPIQYLNQGCVAEERLDGIWRSSSGGTYALERTSEFIKIYTWPRGQEPANLDDETINTTQWGVPSVFLKDQHCNIDDYFLDQKIILNIAFCGNPVAQEWYRIEDEFGQTCQEKSEGDSCVDSVVKYPHLFEDVYFQVRDIRYFSPRDVAADDEAVSTGASSFMRPLWGMTHVRDRTRNTK